MIGSHVWNANPAVIRNRQIMKRTKKCKKAKIKKEIYKVKSKNKLLFIIVFPYLCIFSFFPHLFINLFISTFNYFNIYVFFYKCIYVFI